MKNKILSVDWAFHNTGIALYDIETKIITTTIWAIPNKVKIEWWDISFYEVVKKQFNLFYYNTCKPIDGIKQILVEVGFGKVDKMSLFYAWFYNLWLDKKATVMFINSSEWIRNFLKINRLRDLKKGKDKELLKELFYKRFNNVPRNFSQDEIDAVMMLLNTYPGLEIKEIKRIVI